MEEVNERLTNELTRLADELAKANRRNAQPLADEEAIIANLVASMEKYINYVRYIEAKEALVKAYKEAKEVLAEVDEHAGDYVRPIPPDIRKEIDERTRSMEQAARKFKQAQIEHIYAQWEAFGLGDPPDIQVAQLEATYAKIWSDYVDRFIKERLK